MSRSYRKIPCAHVSPVHGQYKKIYNRKLRRKRIFDVPSGNAYRRMNEAWNIDEARSVGDSYASFRNSRLRWGDFIDERTCRNEYAKYYLRK